MNRFIEKVKTWPVIKGIITVTYRDVVKRGLLTPFLVFVAFLLSFGVTRAVAYAFPSLGLTIGKYDIHHFYYGILLLIASNWITLASRREGPRHIAAALFGIGLGFIADEVGLLLTCTSPLKGLCDYRARVTWDLFTIIVGLFMTVLYFVPIWRMSKNIVIEVLRFVFRFLWTKLRR